MFQIVRKFIRFKFTIHDRNSFNTFQLFITAYTVVLTWYDDKLFKIFQERIVLSLLFNYFSRLYYFQLLQFFNALLHLNSRLHV